jgi:Protein of unknown function (DUF4232)
MNRSPKAIAAAMLVSLIAGCSVAGGVSAAHDTRVAPCAARALVLRHGTAVVPMTGEHAVMYRLTNRGPVSCTVRGYPRVVLYDAKGRALPFRYADGGGAYVTVKKPVTVVLKPGASAYVLVAKYRCDLGIVRNATTIRLTLATADGKAFTKREAVGVSGAPGLSYCRGGQHDPGQKVVVSPVEPKAQATTSLG